MKHLYDELSYTISKSTTRKYSTSFSLGILALKPTIRKAIYAIYGYVRLADEIVDSFHGFDQKQLLEQFKIQTYKALEDKISLNPIMQSFQMTVSKYAIDPVLINHFLESMEMDLYKIEYDHAGFEKYIFGSAEVVGLMCLQVFTEGNLKQFELLKPYAMKLGAAFQKINFLRDLKDDYHILGRTYFPDVEMSSFDAYVKTNIEQEIEQDFKEALIGIKQLPPSSKFGVYLAYRYYLSLFYKIQTKSYQEILHKRVRVPNAQKAYLAFTSYIKYKTAGL